MFNADAYWKEIIDSFQEGLLVVDTEGTIALVNKAMTELTGFSEAELIGASCTVLDCDACTLMRAGGADKWCRLFEKGAVHNRRCTLTRKDGSYVTVVKNARILCDGNDRAVGALETYSDNTELDLLELKVQELSRMLQKDTGFFGMVGMSQAMQKIYQITEKAAQSDATVLISGESGTGKELVAQAVHLIGRRNKGPFVKINCAALSQSLIESELFGHAKGAFTGAYRHRKGLFEMADGGDLFLDEIGEMPLATQVKLLRVLETKQFEHVGGNRTFQVDVRIITATNRNLSDMVKRGEFREDLYFRINVFPIGLPPLRDRAEDIPLLVNAFVGELRQDRNRRIRGVSSEVMDVFMKYRWPGNVRELKTALEYAFAIADAGLIEAGHLPVQFGTVLQGNGTGFTRAHPPTHVEAEATEREELLEALRQSGGNRTLAAKILGVHRMTVWNRMRKYGITL